MDLVGIFHVVDMLSSGKVWFKPYLCCWFDTVQCDTVHF